MVTAVDTKLTEINGKPLAPTRSVADDTQILDRNWAKVAFMVAVSPQDNQTDINNRYWSSASAKFTDSRLGCDIGINGPTQWTRYADLRVPGRIRDRNKVSITNVSGNYGWGRAFSEGINDPAQRVYMRMGVPKFNSLVNFLTRAFDREMTIMARTGRPPTLFYEISKIVGTAITAINFPLLTVTVEAGKGLSWLMGRQTSKFFTLRPTMHMYWSMVNSLVNNHAVNVGIFKRVLSDENEQQLGKPYKLDEEQMGELSAMMPDIFNGHGFYDIYAMANKAQRLAHAQFMIDYKELDNASATKFEGYLKRDNSGNGRHSTYISDDKGKPTLAAWFNKVMSLGDYYRQPEKSGDKSDIGVQETDPRLDPAAKDGSEYADKSHLAKMREYADAEWRDGSEFAVFKVEYTGSISEAFGNSVAESQLSQEMNSISSKNREARFSLADGNIVGGIIGDIGAAVGQTILGALDGVTLGLAGLVPGLGGSGYLDIPKHWQSSSATLPRGSYTMQLRCAYNNPIAQMNKIWIPFYMLLATAIPRSTGKQSYTSPFYCQFFERGKVQSRLAMVEQIRINRGTTNMGFDTRGTVLGIDVSIDIVDLSTIMHMPMSTGGLLEVDMSMDDDNITQDYLAVLSGMDIYSQIYPFPRGQLKLTKELLKLKQKATSPAYHASLFKNSVENGFINDITFGLSGMASNLYSGMVKGSSVVEGPNRIASQ